MVDKYILLILGGTGLIKKTILMPGYLFIFSSGKVMRDTKDRQGFCYILVKTYGQTDNLKEIFRFFFFFNFFWVVLCICDLW